MVSTFRVRLADCRFPLHDLDPRHMFPAPGQDVADGPIAVSRLDNGEWFVQDGRHRVIRARLRGDVEHEAFDHDDAVFSADPHPLGHPRPVSLPPQTDGDRPTPGGSDADRYVPLAFR